MWGFKWVLRLVWRHSKRTVLLVDAQAVMGAVGRGRSSARCLSRDVAYVGALAMAGDLALKLVHILSEDNPGDVPSRGRHWRRRRSAIPAAARRTGGPDVGVLRNVKHQRGTFLPPDARRQAHEAAQLRFTVKTLEARTFKLLHECPHEKRADWKALIGALHEGDSDSTSSIFSV